MSGVAVSDVIILLAQFPPEMWTLFPRAPCTDSLARRNFFVKANSNPEDDSPMECHGSVRQGVRMAVAAGGFLAGGRHHTGDELM